MTLNEMIYHRKSCRSYTGVPVDEEMLEKIRAFEMKPLYPEIKVKMEIVRREQVVSPLKWLPPQMIAIYSEKADGYLENVGFMFQQLDLYLQTLGLGACWIGLGRMHTKTAPEVEGMKFIILLAFGHPQGDQLRHDTAEFRRKGMMRIANRNDERLEPARLAPSGVNSQPWGFYHEGDRIHVYCERTGGKLDVGIALAHLYVANEMTFRFFKVENLPDSPGHRYVGSVDL